MLPCGCDLGETARRVKEALNFVLTEAELVHAHVLFHAHASPDVLLRLEGFCALAVSVAIV